LDFNNIPGELKKMHNWVLWKLEDRKGAEGKKAKIPYTIYGKMASSNKPLSWTTFEQAIEVYTHSEIYSGIGFMFQGTGITGVDKDHCIENGVISDEAQYIIDTLDSYTEKSQSGSGIHVLVKGTIPKAIKKEEIEMYDTGRYFVVTGDLISKSNKVEERQPQLDALYKIYQKHKDVKKEAADKIPAPKEIQSCSDLLEKAFYGKNGFKIKALYSGDMSSCDNDHSRADQSLCNYLAYYFDNDFNDIDEAFEGSGLYREKWDREDYKTSTIDKAIEGCTKTYQDQLKENKEKKKKEADKISDVGFPFKNFKNQPLKVWENLYYLLKLNKIEVKYNLLSREIEVINSKKSLDDMMVEFNTLALTNGLNIGIDEMTRFIKKIAKENSYNPVMNYLRKCKTGWDGVSRIKELCDTIQCYGDNDFKELLITKWLVNAVHIISNKGNNNCEGVLVIQGKQNIGKTRWIRSLMPNLQWLKTGVAVDPGDKDSVAKATKYWIVELGEMEATLKKDQAELKQFFTENSDEYREAYGRFSSKFPRLTCFYATVNDLEFLKDVTGNRRYWAIEALSINVDHNINLEQLWGEVVTLYSTGKITNWLTKDQQVALQDNNIKFEVKTNTEIKLLDSFDWEDTNVLKWKYFTSTEIADLIGEKNPVLIGRTIRKMMLNNKLIDFNTNGRKYLLPPRVINRNLYEFCGTSYK